MKILDILIKEDFEFDNGVAEPGERFKAPKVSTSELGSLELDVLRKIQRGAFNIESPSLSDAQVDAYMELQALGFVDEDGNLTSSGNEVSHPADLSTTYRGAEGESTDSDVAPDMDELEAEDDIDYNLAGYRRVREGTEGFEKSKQELAKNIANLKAHLKEYGMPDAERKRVEEMLAKEEGKLAKLRTVKENWDDEDNDDYDDRDLDDEEHDPDVFANPGSALRVSGRNNPRNLPCPTCLEPNRITREDRARHYQCDECADRAEGKWNGRGEY